MSLKEKLYIHWILLRPFAILGLIPPFLLGVLIAMQTVKIDWTITLIALVGSTLIVIISVALLAVFIGVVDLILSRFVGLLLR